MNSANLTRDEVSARSRAVEVIGYRVELDVVGAPDPSRPGFTTVTTVEFTTTEAQTWLDFLGSSVESVTVNGAAAVVEFDGARIRLRDLAERNVVTVHATGAYSRSGEGLHRFRDPADGQTYLYTQYEPADARRVFACFEQPDLKAPFTFVVTAPAGWEVVSNQTATDTATATTGGGESKTVTFAPTLPISTYLTAVVAGPYHRVESSWVRGDLTVPLGVLCRASLAGHLDADEVFEVTAQGLDFYAVHFDYPYPFGKYDQVFVPEYNLGAMENPGCVTFTESYVFRGKATVAQHQRRANTILHEMAHMWFGDLVTMRWWDDLWLKESFADYMGALACAEATEFTDAWVAFANGRKAWAYSQDQLPTTHPIVADIVDLEAAKLNFDGITYAKGASVLKQLVAYVGREAFFAGARRYFRDHAYGNTTLSDLLGALERESGRDLRAWSRAWLQTTGVSTIRYDGGALVQSQARPHRIAVGFYDFDRSGALVRLDQVALDLIDARTPVEFASAALVLINDEDWTYAKVRLDQRSLATVECALDKVADPLARGLIWSALWNACRDGELPVARYLAVVRAFAPSERNVSLLTVIVANAYFAVDHYVPEAQRASRWRDWLDTSWAAMHSAAPGSGEQLTWARAVAGAAMHDDSRAVEIRALLDGVGAAPAGLVFDPDLRWALWRALATVGRVGAGELDAELALDDSAAGRTAQLMGLAARPEEVVKADVWRRIFEDRALSNDELDALIGGFGAGDRRDLIARFDDDYFAAIESVWSQRSIEIARRIVIGLFPLAASLEAVDRWLASHADAPAALRRLVIERRDHLARDLRVRAANAGTAAAGG